MKKSFLVKLATLVISACAMLGIGTACGESQDNGQHKHSYTQKVTAPTCTEKGYTTYTCACSHSYVDNYVDELGHSYTNYVSQGDGMKIATCDNGCKGTDKIADVDVGLFFTLNEIEDSYTLVKYVGIETTLAIPSMHNGLPVVSIGDSAFEVDGIPADFLTEVVIPDSVTSIGDYAFSGCSSLTEVVIPDSVTSIGERAFSYCRKLTELTVDKNNATYQSIKGNIYSKDGKTLLQYATGKTNASFLIPDTVTSIGEYAFYNCLSLTEVVIPDSVTSIGDYAFSYCSSLTKIVIPDSVTSIGEYAFEGYGCSSLTIYCEAKNQPSGWYNEWNYRDYPVVWDCNNNEDANDGCIYTIIDGLRYALKGGEATVVEQPQNIKTATIPSSVTYKGTSYTVTSIGSYAFSRCGSLTEVVIPDSVMSIGGHAFYYCSSLTEVVIPDSVTSIGHDAFYYCESLTIYCEAESEQAVWSWYPYWKSHHSPVVWDCNNNDVADDGYIYLTVEGIRYVISNGEATVVRQAENITTAKILPQITYKGVSCSVTSIGKDAFYQCRSLTEVVIPDSVTSIGEYAFELSGLTEIIIPQGVISIDEEAFGACFYLKKVIIPDSVTSIGKCAFAGCSSLTEIIVAKNNKAYQSIDGDLYSKDGKTFIQYAVGKTNVSFAVPKGVTKIADGAFCLGYNLIEIIIPDGVTSLGESAIMGCGRLTKVVIPDSVTSIDRRTFFRCDNLQYTTKNQLIYLGNEKNPYVYLIGTPSRDITSAMIENGCKTIGYGAFSNFDSLTEVVIPDSVTSIGDYAFNNCSSLTSVYYKGTASDKEQLNIYDSNDYLTATTWYYYSETTPTDTGNYWRYDTDGVTPVIWD